MTRLLIKLCIEEFREIKQSVRHSELLFQIL